MLIYIKEGVLYMHEKNNRKLTSVLIIILAAILFFLIGGLGGYYLRDCKCICPDCLTVDNDELPENSESLFYASEDDKYVLVLTTYKNRKGLNPKGGVSDDRGFILSLDSMQSIEKLTGSYNITDGKIALTIDGYNGFIWPDGVPVVDKFGTTHVELNYTDDVIMLGNVSLYSKQ